MIDGTKSGESAGETASAQPAKRGRSRIFIVDDHMMFREGLRHLIDHEPDMITCGGASSAEEAMRQIGSAKPDLVIVDISLGETSGIDLIQELQSKDEDLPILVVSMHDESLYADRAMRAGAMGYVMKQEPSETVKVAIRKVLSGGIHLSEKMSESMLVRLMRGAEEPKRTPVELLSDREMEVFRLLGHGKGARQIAEEMGLTINTINSFRHRIKEKLKLKSSSDLMLRAIKFVQGELSR